jgi:hypothetical protein
VGAKKKTIVGLFVFNPLCSQPPVTYTVHCGLIPACMCMNQFKENRLSKLRRYIREQAVVLSVPIRPTNFLEMLLCLCVYLCCRMPFKHMVQLRKYCNINFKPQIYSPIGQAVFVSVDRAGGRAGVG